MPTTTYIKNLTREVRLSYLQSLQASQDIRDLQALAGVTPPSQASSTSSSGGSSGFLGIGAEGASTTTVSSDDTGWIISRTWRETVYDKARYAIGIRDIAMFKYQYAPSSEIVSRPFVSPKEIMKVQLRVDEFIPSVLPDTRRWIQYYITIDDGDTWIQMNPLDQPTLFDANGNVVPQTLTFNLDDAGPQGENAQPVLTEQSVKRIRFRAVFNTDSTLVDGDKYTPILKSYRLLILPRGGLRDSGI